MSYSAWGQKTLYNFQVDAGVTNLVSDYNLVFADTPNATGYYAYVGAVSKTLAEWNAIVGVGTDLNADPLFVDAAGGDFHLQPNSPCVDTGTDVGLTTAYDGGPVGVGGGIDIGAYDTTHISLWQSILGVLNNIL